MRYWVDSWTAIGPTLHYCRGLSPILKGETPMSGDAVFWSMPDPKDPKKSFIAHAARVVSVNSDGVVVSKGKNGVYGFFEGTVGKLSGKNNTLVGKDSLGFEFRKSTRLYAEIGFSEKTIVVGWRCMRRCGDLATWYNLSSYVWWQA